LIPVGTTPPGSTLSTALQACATALQTNTNVATNKGNRWGWGATGITLFNTVVPPNSSQYAFGACRHDRAGCSPDQSVFVNAQSAHPGGVNVALTDGSVRFVKDTIDWGIWWALGTRDGGEAISADEF
jgi:prepilin-type processing-associated H-X9-DG protein